MSVLASVEFSFPTKVLFTELFEKSDVELADESRDDVDVTTSYSENILNTNKTNFENTSLKFLRFLYHLTYVDFIQNIYIVLTFRPIANISFIIIITVDIVKLSRTQHFNTVFRLMSPGSGWFTTVPVLKRIWDSVYPCKYYEKSKYYHP
jgi:hypothetical protein